MSRAPLTSIPAIPVEEVSDLADALLLDVREPFEFAAGHAPGAVNVPLGQLAATAVDGNHRVAVICRSGNRSAMAVGHLRQRGIDAVNVTGGMAAWVAAGLPVEQPASIG